MRATSYGVGKYAAGESHAFIARTDYRPDGTHPGIIFAPSHGNTAIQALTPTYVDTILNALAEAGYAVLAVDAGGVAAWGNATAVARVTDAKTYLQGTLGAKSGKVGLFAFSMGSLDLLNWARTNMASVAAMAFVAPAVDLADLHDNRGFATEINTAYGGVPSYATNSPVQYAASLTVPCKVWNASDDATVIPSTVAAFTAAYGGPISRVDLGAVGHTPVTTPPQAVVDHFSANL
jgi:pimeloyl-ACP methyl ester carboxylesterase